MSTVKDRLRRDSRERQRAIAMFCVSTAEMANQLLRITKIHDQGLVTDESEETAKFLEDKIKKTYQEHFDCELGNLHANLLTFGESSRVCSLSGQSETQ